MYSPDLAHYSYLRQSELADVVTIGWLSEEHEFATGDIGDVMVRAIEGLLWSNCVNKTRGIHRCRLCPAREPIEVTTDRGSLLLGSAEIWLPSADESVVFAAPDLIVHYVLAHKYRPPPPFLEAVTSSGTHPNWNPRLEYKRRYHGAFGKRR